MFSGNALRAIKQICGELGLEVPVTISSSSGTNTSQMLALANSAGAELATFFTWSQLNREWNFSTTPGQDSYDMPSDWGFFLDQTQWDRTDHWPLMGPKTATEWQWLKGGLLSQGPRLRYRVYDNKFWLHPAPGSTPFNIAMEYISTNWVQKPGGGTDSFITEDADIPNFDFWLFTKFVKLKYLEAKGLDTTAAAGDFLRMFDAITGRDKGAPILNLSPRYNTILITPNNVPDGSWPIGASTP